MRDENKKKVYETQTGLFEKNVSYKLILSLTYLKINLSKLS